MAEVIKRTWRSGPRRVKRVAWGYTMQVNGKQVRVTRETWTKEDAEKELAAAQLGQGVPKPAASTLTVAEAVERFVKAKARKRTIAQDARHLRTLTEAFGADTPLREITAARISAWKAEMLAAICPTTRAPYSAAAINRPLQALSGLLHIAHEEWEVIPSVPRIRLEKEPQERIRWLESDEEGRLLDACRAIKTTPDLADIVTVALETGLRKGELLSLTWERIDLSRGVIRLEITKSRKRREVPMRQVVYEVLARRPGTREGQVWPARIYIDHAFQRAVRAAKLDEHFRFHDCRHHFASWFMMRGGSLQALMEILGHANIKMTLRYAHLSPGHLRQEMAKTERPASAQDQHMASEMEPIAS